MAPTGLPPLPRPEAVRRWPCQAHVDEQGNHKECPLVRKDVRSQGGYASIASLRDHYRKKHPDGVPAAALEAVDLHTCTRCGFLAVHSGCQQCKQSQQAPVQLRLEAEQADEAHVGPAAEEDEEAAAAVAAAPIEQQATEQQQPAAAAAVAATAASATNAATDPQQQPAFPPQMLVCRHVPYAAQQELSDECISKMSTAIQRCKQGHDDKARQAVYDVQAVFARTLSDLGNSRSAARTVMARLRDMRAGMQLHLQNTDHQVRYQAEEEREARRIDQAIAAGSITTASNALEPGKVATWGSDSHQKAQALFPKAAQPIQVPATATAHKFSFAPELMGEQLSTAPRDSAGGCDRVTYPHLNSVFQHADEAGKAVFCEYFSMLASNELPMTPSLTDCRLILLEKPGGGLRPIAIESVFMRLTGRCVIAELRADLKLKLPPHQLGVGMAGGSQNVAHAVQSALAADPEAVVVALDARNAYGLTELTPLFREIAEVEPRLLPFAVASFAKPTRLWPANAPPGTPPVMRRTGMLQGSSIAPAAFGIDTLRVLHMLREQHPQAGAVAYLDDNYVVAKPQAAVAAVQALGPALKERGQSLAPEKSMVHGANTEAVEQVAEQLGFTACPDGIKCVGTPIGTAGYVRMQCMRMADQVCAKMDKVLLQPKLTVQTKLLLVRRSLQYKLSHLERTVRKEECAGAVARMEAHARSVVLELLQLEDAQLSNYAEAQLVAPLRHGGLGLESTSDAEFDAAFCASAGLAQQALQGAHDSMQPLRGAYGALVQQKWAGLQALHPEQLGDEAGIDAALASGKLVSAQSAVSRAIADSSHAALLSSCDTTTAEGEEAAARLRSTASYAAGAWLDALPKKSGRLALNNAAVRIAATSRIGMARVPPCVVGTRCSCGHRLHAHDGEHAQDCSQTGQPVTARHNLVNSEWCQAGRRAGCSCTIEPLRDQLRVQAGQQAQHTKCAGDILMTTQKGMLVLDTSIVHPMAQSYAASAAQVTGAAAQAREAHKIAQYKADVENGVYEFEPLVTESLGLLAQGSERHLKRLADIAAESGVSKSVFKRNTKIALSVALWRGNARIMQKGMQEWSRASGRQYMQGLSNPTADLI